VIKAKPTNTARQPTARTANSTGERAAQGRDPQHHRFEAAHQPPGEAEADQGARERQDHHVLADREQERACRGAAEQAELDATRAVAVEQHAQWQLKQREREQIGRGQQAELGRAEADVGGQLGPDHRVHRTEQVGEEIAERERRQDGANDCSRTELRRCSLLWHGARPRQRQSILPI
jgi:hypothetical protein